MVHTSPQKYQRSLGALVLNHPLGYLLRHFVAAGYLLPFVARADEPPPVLQPPVEQAEMEPEEVARRFFVGLLTRDKTTIERYILPEEHSEVLWNGPSVSEASRRAAHKQVDEMKFRRMQPGDVVTAANGKKYTIEERQVNAGRVLLLPDGFHLPFALVRQPDGWKVKATTMIAARLEAPTDSKAK